MSSIAIIPARGGSKRLPRKNILPIGGKPMLCWPLAAALESREFERVIVSSEDEEIQMIARDHGAEVIERPQEIAGDTIHELEACKHILEAIAAEGQAEPEDFCVIYPTAIFLTPDDFNGARKALDAAPGADALMCVSGFNYHPYKALVQDESGYLQMLYPKEGRERSQTYPYMCASNGTFYWLRTASFKKSPEKSYYQDRLIPYEIEAQRAIDIDEPGDLHQADALFQQNRNK